MVDRVVVQFDKRDVETLKLIKLDLLGLGMLAAMDETLQLIEHDCAVCLDLDRMPEDVPEVFEMLQAADTVGRLPGREPGPDADAAEVAPEEPRRPGGRGRDHPAGADPGQRGPSVPAPEAGAGAGDVPPPEPRAGPEGLDGRDPLPGAGHAHRDRGGGVHAGRIGRLPAGDGHVAVEPRDGEAPPAVRRRLHAPAGHDRGDRRGAVPAGRGVRELRVRQVPCRRVRADRLRVVVPEAVLPGPVPGRAHQRPADGLLSGRGPGQRHEAPRGGRAAGRHQRVDVQDHDRMGRAARGAAAAGAPGSPPGRNRSARPPASCRPPRRATAGRRR